MIGWVKSLSDRMLVISSIGAGVVALDWSSKLWAQENVSVVYNDRSVQWEFIPVLFGLFVFLLAAQNDWLTPIALGLIAGGWVANIGERAWIGPVTDFIPFPKWFETEFYGNIADIAVLTAATIFVFVVIRSAARAFRHYRDRRREE